MTSRLTSRQTRTTGWSRRAALRSLVGGSVLLPGIVAELLATEAGDSLASKPPHFEPKALRMIFLYMSGGVSHVDTFDPKPALVRDHGKPYKGGFLKQPDWGFARFGKSGTEISALFPNLARRVDDLCLIRSLQGDHANHVEATLGIHTGSVTFTRPSLGSWVSYGLGTMNRNLPSFMVLAPANPYAGDQVWSSDFLPAEHAGVRIRPAAQPIPNLVPLQEEAHLQDLELQYLRRINGRHLARKMFDPRLEARMRTYETAFGMQMQAPEAFDISREPKHIQELYGIKAGGSGGFGWQCLVARRLLERGVRFVELIDSGSNNNWDSHSDMSDHARLAMNVDKPMAGLLEDLRQRGLLEDTLVVWATEFGRTPAVAQVESKGREHHANVFSAWMAGAGVRAGMAYGQSDEYGMEVVEGRVRMHDFHATILHLLGLDHKRLTYRHAGRDFRLTDIGGEVVQGILS